MPSVTGVAQTSFHVNLLLNDILQPVCSKKVQQRCKPLRKQRLYLKLELSFASLVIVNIFVNLNSKSEPRKGHLKQVQILSCFKDDLLWIHSIWKWKIFCWLQRGGFFLDVFQYLVHFYSLTNLLSTTVCQIRS